ncbi:OpgC domain-containing protein [Solicola sp. PLA-1-18]|uniref:OpgC domain-containing protein n=1 Tax=Solicola sp. PLA-1-18 TaxID=3380532 RepID=UPI003B807C17
MTPRPARVLLALLVCVLALLGPAGVAVASDGGSDDPPALTPGAHPWFGPELDWTNDSAQQYVSRLGEGPSVFAQAVRYPLTGDDGTYLEEFVAQAARHGSIAELTLEPQQALETLTAADAARLGRALVALHEDYDSEIVVRFAPEMNGSWTSWGQQPEAYVAAYREVASAVHAATPHAVMLWAPAYGAGYPFSRAFGAVEGSGPRDEAQLDTDGDGEVTEADDPYGPYYPGDAAVDWVGLSLYHFGAAQDFGSNVAPRRGELEARLAETYGYGDDRGRTPFYERFAERRDKPMAVATGALFNPGRKATDSELDIKRTWWRQVLGATGDHPRIASITWLEEERPEAEVGGDTVDWRATHTDDLAGALRADLARYQVATGPVTRVLDQQAANTATSQVRETGGNDQMGWIVATVAVMALAFVSAGVVRRLVPSWGYDPTAHGARDLRLDFLRGFIIIAVVVTHVEVAGPYSWITLNAIGGVTGAELFVLLSGVVMGMVQPAVIHKLGEWGAAVAAFKRARKLYLTALVVVVLVYALGRVPGVDATAITTFTDRGTGALGQGASGQVYDLYGNFPRLLDYPPPGYAVRQLLLLEMGPWVFNIMGLFIVLSLLLVPLAWLLRRRLWWAALVLSWTLYLLQAHFDWDVMPSQFEDVFPLLTWQVVFVHGLVIGWYRRQVTAALTSRIGVVLTTIGVLAYAGVLALLWAGHTYGFAVPFADAGTYDALYPHLYTRVFLQPGRLLDLLLVIVVAYAVLTAWWKPLSRALGWLYVPLGQNSLYVFTVHVFFVLAVANVPGLVRTSDWQGTVIHTVVVATIWVMVRRRFLFSVIPR